MRIASVDLRTASTHVELRGLVHADALAEPFRLWFRFPLELADSVCAETGDPFVAACLLPAMSSGERLQLSVPVSKRLLRSIQRIQAVHTTWNPFLSHVEVEAEACAETATGGGRTGLFFSTGVDSSYSLIRSTMRHPVNQDTIQHLLVVDGFPEIGKDEDLFARVLGNVGRVAAHFGKSVIPVATNVQDLMSRFGVPWMFAHGAALASVGLALQRTLSRILVPSTFSYAALYPMGTHPVLDPLWSSERVEFVHDGCEADRLEKVRLIATESIVLDVLRSCFSTGGNGFNCGRCVKCCQTMAQLHIVGALARCRTFPEAVDVDAVRRLSPLYSYQIDGCRSIADELGSSEQDQRIRAAFMHAADAGERYSAGFTRARKTILRVIPPKERFILVDGEAIRLDLGAGLRAVPLMERGGLYNGRPADGASALSELLRLRDAGAGFAAFWHDAFWYFDAYPELTRFLEASCRRVAENGSVVVYDLRAAPRKGA